MLEEKRGGNNSLKKSKIRRNLLSLLSSNLIASKSMKDLSRGKKGQSGHSQQVTKQTNNTKLKNKNKLNVNHHCVKKQNVLFLAYLSYVTVKHFPVMLFAPLLYCICK